MFEGFPWHELIWVDYAIASLLSIAAIIGLLRGAVKEAFTLLTWMAAWGLGLYYSRDFAMLLQTVIIYPTARIVAGFGLLFCMTLLLGRLIAFILQYLFEKTGLTGSDRLLGMLFGVMRGSIWVGVAVMLAGVTRLPEEPWWKQSLLIPPFQFLAVWLKDHIPSALAGYIHYR